MTEPDLDGTWATAADVLAMTGETVTGPHLLQAQATIDLHAGRIYADRERIGTRDQHWLRMATIYQAAWLLEQPDAFIRTEVVSTGSTNGVHYAPEALTIGPFARKALSRVSWIRSRSLRVRPPGDGRDESEEDRLDWRPV